MANSMSGHGRRKKPPESRKPLPDWVWFTALALFVTLFAALISYLAISFFYEDTPTQPQTTSGSR